MKRTILILSLAAFVCACSSRSAGRLAGTYPGDTPPEVPGLTFVKVPTTLFTVSNVSWYDVQEFILRLRSLTGRPFRLPSEDEWEYAARGGRKTEGYIFSGSNSAQEVAVCTHKNKDGESVRPAPADVGSRLPNELGLHDMSGSVWEWVRGEHPDGGAIQKGGSRLSLNTACRVSNRQAMDPGTKKDTFGFRLAL